MTSRSTSLLAVAFAFAVAPLALPAQWGLKVGASFANVSNSGALPGNPGTRTGLAGGVSLRLGSGTFSLGIEGLYDEQGLDATGGGLQLNMADVPAYLNWRIINSGIGLTAYAGPQVSFLISCKNSGVDCPSGTVASTTYAGIIGARVKFGSSQGFGLTGEARYIYGLTNLNKDTITNPGSYETRSLLVMAGVEF
jgi:hypothetical protein